MRKTISKRGVRYRWECKPDRKIRKNQILDEDYYSKIEFLERTIDDLKCTIEDLKTIWENRCGR